MRSSSSMYVSDSVSSAAVKSSGHSLALNSNPRFACINQMQYQPSTRFNSSSCSGIKILPPGTTLISTHTVRVPLLEVSIVMDKSGLPAFMRSDHFQIVALGSTPCKQSRRFFAVPYNSFAVQLPSFIVVPAFWWMNVYVWAYFVAASAV